MKICCDHAHVCVPATSANLGSGFDSLGLAIDLCDEIDAYAVAGPSSATIEGIGAHNLPCDENHLIIRTIHRVLDELQVSQVGVRLHCVNRIPQGKGLGSSAAAIVAGLLIARTFLGADHELDDRWLLQKAASYEGHADNVAPAIYGGVTLAWHDTDKKLVRRYHACRLCHHQLSHVTLCTPHEHLETTRARGVIPARVPHSDAAQNSAISALFVHAIEHDSSLLYEATQDYLHQEYRRDMMPSSLDLLDYMRASRLPAVISGAGPSVCVLTSLPQGMTEAITREGWSVYTSDINTRGAYAQTTKTGSFDR